MTHSPGKTKMGRQDFPKLTPKEKPKSPLACGGGNSGSVGLQI
ncbi:hypothetical protein D082_22250 [Synechocystis sp. PCC 6714]|nr:hypothetical protein D082_22250 [Synechocystis sp. PCC 6714]